MRYRCPSCKEIRDEDICPVCGILTEPLSEETSGELDRGGAAVPPPPPPPVELVPPPPPPDASEAAEPRLAEAPSEKPPAAEPAPPAAEPEPVPVETPAPRFFGAEPERPASGPLIPQAGQQHLAQYVDDGYEVYLIAGIAAAGKTQLLDAYRRDAFLSTFVKRKGLALPTSPNQLDCHPVSVGRRKVVFVDTSGEHFKRLYPHLSPTGEVSEPEVDFLRLISRRLSGLVLLVDLQRLWTPALRTNPEDEAQIEILSWILILLRWLERAQGARSQGGEVGAGRLRFQDYVNREVMRYRRRMKAPVLVLFSRADELVDVAVPERSGAAWAARAANGRRTLFPVGESPLLLAYHRLPKLLHVLETHAEHFRFDFVHSLVTDRDTGEIVDPNACGVALSLAWLLDRGWRWPSVPTRYWIALERVLDKVRGRGELWERLPDPEDAT